MIPVPFFLSPVLLAHGTRHTAHGTWHMALQLRSGAVGCIRLPCRISGGRPLQYPETGSSTDYQRECNGR